MVKGELGLKDDGFKKKDRGTARARWARGGRCLQGWVWEPRDAPGQGLTPSSARPPGRPILQMGGPRVPAWL